jgi:hypothetical protein
LISRYFDEFSPAIHCDGDWTARLSCVREETGLINRPKWSELIWARTQRTFPKSRDFTVVSPAPISETPVQCGKKRLWRIVPDFIGYFAILLASESVT